MLTNFRIFEFLNCFINNSFYFSGEFEYELVLRTDMYTKRHTQWYYFRLQKVQRNVSYKFNIINLLKKDSLYNYGKCWLRMNLVGKTNKLSKCSIDLYLTHKHHLTEVLCFALLCCDLLIIGKQLRSFLPC